jgi:1,4-alpha-glucan branching enzyme
MSSWGHKGYCEVWLNNSNDYIYRHLHKAVERMINLAGKFNDARGILRRALNQALRELLLSQHSDWAFIMDSSTAAGYARKRFEEHILRFNNLYHAIISRNIPEKWLGEIEEKDSIFQDIDYRVFRNEE